MALHEFSLANLLKLDDGRVAEAWQQAVDRAIRDCEDRPGHDKARKVILELELTPQMHQSCLDTVDAAFKIKDTVPTRESKKYNLGLRKKRGQLGLVFNDLSDDDAQQRTIDEIPGAFDAEE